MFISSAIAQTAAATTGGDGASGLMNLLPIFLMFGVLWFVMIRPQMRKAKEHAALVAALTKGDEVVTTGGLLGKVSTLGDNYVGLEVADGVVIQVQRPAIQLVLPKGTIK